MARTESKMVPLGTAAPQFQLIDVVSGKTVSLNSKSIRKGYLVMFICNHCPFVKHVQHELKKIGDDFSDSLQIVAISSNDALGYPEDAPEKMKDLAIELGFSFPYLFDDTQNVARSFDAVCTPDFFLYDSEQRLFYRGQLDESRPGNGKEVNGQDLRKAISCLLENKGAPQIQKASLGCNIKFRKSL